MLRKHPGFSSALSQKSTLDSTEYSLQEIELDILTIPLFDPNNHVFGAVHTRLYLGTTLLYILLASRPSYCRFQDYP